MRPRRCITAHWHCFLDPDRDLAGRMFKLYQWLALQAVPFLSAVVTTSPLLAEELRRCGCAGTRVFVLPCCLSLEQEKSLLALPAAQALHQESFMFCSLVVSIATSV